MDHKTGPVKRTQMYEDT